MSNRTKMNVLRQAVHNILKEMYPEDVSIQQIYDGIEKSLTLHPEDWEPSSPTNNHPAWKRNVRNVLQTDKNKPELLEQTKSSYYRASPILSKISDSNETNNVEERAFSFTPGKSKEKSHSIHRKKVEETTINREHRILQKKLYKTLVARYDEDQIAEEHAMRWGEADILVKDGDGFIIYEIKTSDTCRECVKEALGQLMVYGFWPNSPKINGLVIVGKPELDTRTGLFMDTLTKKLGVSVMYQKLSL